MKIIALTAAAHFKVGPTYPYHN